MKKFRSRLAIILTMMMIFTSFEFVGVFAGDEDVPEDNPVASEQAQDVDTPVADPEDTAVTLRGDEQNDPPSIEKVTLEPYAGCDWVHFLWAPVEGADGYEISVNGGEWQDYTDDNDVVAKREDVNKLHYRVYAPAGSCAAYAGTKATLSVRAYVISGGERIYSEEATASSEAVRTIAYRLTIKTGGTLKSHGGPRATMTVKKGQVIYAYGFGGGKYIFKNANGSVFYCNKSRTKKRSCIYTRGSYHDLAATYFVNDASTQGRISSNNGRLVWINTYTQTLYVFTGTNGNWTKLVSSKCSTGKASTPSPTGINGKKAIWKKIKKRHGIKWWSPYSDINSIHSKKAKWKIGTPSSNGCVRNYENIAYTVYTQAPIGTPVLSY